MFHCLVRRIQLGLALCASIAAVYDPGRVVAQESGASIYAVPEINVIGVTPVQGSGLDRDRVPVNVITLDRSDIRAGDPRTPADILELRGAGVSRVDSQNNPFQPNITIRGFTASPLLGEPQGLAIYQNGVRINEPFGDTVQWDLMPIFAIRRLQVIQGTNPVFGLNALGGAVTAEMNNGFNFTDSTVRLEGGSFGRVQGAGEYGMNTGKLGVYAGINGVRENGWRDDSPSRLVQGYADAASRGDNHELGAGLTYVRSDLTGNGPAPAELLAADRSAIFTSPDTTKNTLVMLALRGNIEMAHALSFQSSVYFRYNKRNTINGDDSDNGPCEGFEAPPAFLCEEPGDEEEEVEDINGNLISAAAVGNGNLNRQRTITNGAGGSLQATLDKPLFGMRNSLLVGSAIDAGWTKFRSHTELGVLNTDRSVSGAGIFLGTGDFITRLNARNIYYGLYISDTLTLTDRLNVTAAARFNLAEVDLNDRFGTALDGSHRFSRANPSIGMTYQLAPQINLYGVYAEANRIPTPAELSCADPNQPCRFPNAFVSDPPLDQVISRTIEGGVRARYTFGKQADNVEWSLSGFRTRNHDDIIFVSAGPVVGSGFFQNSGETERTGLEFGVQGDLAQWNWYANYAFVRATFESALTILSPDNPSADSDGNIDISPGDRIPNVPKHTSKLGLGYAITDRWVVAAESVITSSRYFRGDENNSQDPLNGAAVFNFWSTRQITDAIQIKLRVNNVFDKKYETFGIYADPTDVFPGFTDNRFAGPGQPRSAWVGLTAIF
ncbi:MAG: TonB-dependent receptor [Alphaproteobacteria bacterium]